MKCLYLLSVAVPNVALTRHMAITKTAVAAALVSGFLEKFREVIREKGQGVVAHELGVDRQTLGAYFRKEEPAEPGFDLIVAAIERYEIVLDRDGFVFGSRKKVTPKVEVYN